MMTKANTKYTTVKRKANVGERILITNAIITEGAYENGDIFTVDTLLDAGVFVKENDDTAMYHREYEVIIGESPSDSERITALESQVAELQAELQALKKRKKPKHLLTHYPTPNEQRKAVIERAKAFVVEHTQHNDSTSKGGLKYYGIQLGWHVVRPEFLVNKEKRAVTVLLKGAATPKLYEKGIAKCAPDDVFNADIGKAIALGRALGLDVSEFENAPKPTEVVVGHTIRSLVYDDMPYYVTEISDGKAKVNNTGHFYGANRIGIAFRITDDTEAQY